MSRTFSMNSGQLKSVLPVLAVRSSSTFAARVDLHVAVCSGTGSRTHRDGRWIEAGDGLTIPRSLLCVPTGRSSEMRLVSQLPSRRDRYLGTRPPDRGDHRPEWESLLRSSLQRFLTDRTPMIGWQRVQDRRRERAVARDSQHEGVRGWSPVPSVSVNLT